MSTNGKITADYFQIFKQGNDILHVTYKNDQWAIGMYQGLTPVVGFTEDHQLNLLPEFGGRSNQVPVSQITSCRKMVPCKDSYADIDSLEK